MAQLSELSLEELKGRWRELQIPPEARGAVGSGIGATSLGGAKSFFGSVLAGAFGQRFFLGIKDLYKKGTASCPRTI